MQISSTGGGGGEGAREWMNQIPRFPSDRMPDDTSRAAHCIWLGAPLWCLAGTTDPLGRSTLRVATAERNALHTALLRALAAALTRAGLAWEPEVVGLFGPRRGLPPGDSTGSERRMDLVAWLHAFRLLIDVTRVDGALAAYLQRATDVAEPLHGVSEAEKEKRRTYPADECPPGFALVPFAMGTQTELGASAASLVNELAKREATRICGVDVPPAAVIARCARVTRRELGVAVMRAQAEQILASLHDTPHAALKRAGQGKARRLIYGQRHGQRLMCVCSSAACTCWSGRLPWELARASPTGSVPALSAPLVAALPSQEEFDASLV